MIPWAIFHEGKRISAPMPKYKALIKYEILSSCLTNLDLRMLQKSGDVISARDVHRRFIRVVGD